MPHPVPWVSATTPSMCGLASTMACALRAISFATVAEQFTEVSTPR